MTYETEEDTYVRALAALHAEDDLLDREYQKDVQYYKRADKFVNATIGILFLFLVVLVTCEALGYIDAYA